MTTASTFGVNPLGYEGIDLNAVANVLQVASRVPTSLDVQPIGTIWPYNGTTPYTLYISQGAGNWDPFSSSAGNLNTLTGNSGGAISPAGGNINIVGAGGTLVSGAGNTLTITAAPQTFSWQSGNAGGTIAVNTGYIVSAGNPVWALPAVSAVGDEFAFILTENAGGAIDFSISQGAAQQITAGTQKTTAGAGTKFTVAPAGVGNGQALWAVCTVANTQWQLLSSISGYTLT